MQIPIVLVSGFLGAGKTTLMRRLILDAHDKGLRLAVIVNEFGEADVDSNILSEADAELIAAISGGCACCSGQDDLQDTLVELAGRPPEQSPHAVLMEASGLADPVLLLDVLTAAPLLPLVRVACVVGVIDAPRYLDIPASLEPLLRRQTALSDLVIINKSDLVSTDELSAVSDRLRTDQPGARLVSARHCEADLQVVWNSLSAARPALDADAGVPAPHAHYHTVICPMPHPAERASLEAALKELSEEVWRVKGFVRLRREPGLFLVQFTGGYSGGGRFRIAPFYLSPGGIEPETLLVFIGPDLDEDVIRKRFGRS